MFLGGMTFAVPGVMPSASAAEENLFVSAENSLFSNSFAGPMVIEVVVNDPDLKEIDEGESEPDVTVNGKDLRMAQADDGNWYGLGFHSGGDLEFGEGSSIQFTYEAKGKWNNADANTIEVLESVESKPKPEMTLLRGFLG